MIDLKKKFDTVSNERFFLKLEHYDVGGFRLNSLRVIFRTDHNI